MRLSPEASRELMAELNRPAADTPGRRYTFERLAEMQDRLDFRASQVVSGRASQKYMASLRKSRHSRMRWFFAFLATAAALFAIMSCASVPSEEEPLPLNVVVVSIENARTHDALDPHFYLLGSGKFSLGIVPDLATRTMLVDRKWLGPDGCFSVIAHYTGSGDWVSERVCWKRGEVVEVKLMPIFSTSSAWSHR